MTTLERAKELVITAARRVVACEFDMTFVEELREAINDLDDLAAGETVDADTWRHNGGL